MRRFRNAKKGSAKKKKKIWYVDWENFHLETNFARAIIKVSCILFNKLYLPKATLYIWHYIKNWPRPSKSSRWMMVRREGHAEFFSHHVQSLHMGPKGNAMTRYWQY